MNATALDKLAFPCCTTSWRSALRLRTRRAGWARPPRRSTSPPASPPGACACCWWISIRKAMPRPISASPPTQRAKAATDLFTPGAPPSHPLPTPVPNLYLLGAGMNLAGIEVELAADGDRALRLGAALGPVANCRIRRPDPGLPAVLRPADSQRPGRLQCRADPPAMRVLRVGGTGASHPHHRGDAPRLQPALAISGIVLTMYDRRNNLSELVASDVRSFFGDKVLRHRHSPQRETDRGPQPRLADFAL